MTSSQNDPRLGQDDTIGGDARDDEPEGSPGPFRYPVSSRESDEDEHELLGGNDEFFACITQTKTEIVEHVVDRLNMAHNLVEKMRLMGWQDLESGRVGNRRLDLSFDDWDSALDWCVGEACE